MTITQLECFNATIRHQPHQGILAHAGFTLDLAGRVRRRLGIGESDSILTHLGLYDPVFVAPQRTASTPTPDFTPYFRDITIPPGARFSEVGTLRVPAGYYHFDGLICPLRHATTLDEIRAFPFPVYEGYDESGMAEMVADAHARGRVAAGAVGHLFENAWQIRGMEPFLIDMLAAPENCDFIFDRLHAFQKARAFAEARAGVDYIHTGDDVATQQAMMFGVAQWRAFIKPRWADIYAAVKAINPEIRIWYHSDGNILDIIPELIEIGVDILNPIQPECLDPFAVHRQWGDRLVLDGCIGTQSVMPFGSPADVRDTVRRLVDGLGGQGALILAPTHTLEPEVPIANIEAFVETVREYGDVV